MLNIPVSQEPIASEWRMGQKWYQYLIAIDRRINFIWNGLFITPQMFGAKGDGIADDTAAVQAAFDASTGGILYIPHGQYRLYKASGTELILWSNPARVIGVGARPTGSVFLVDDDTPTTIDIIRVVPDTAYTNGVDFYWWSIEEVMITTETTVNGLTPGTPGPARYGFHIDLPDDATVFLAHFLMRRCLIAGQSKDAFRLTRAGSHTDNFFICANEQNYFQAGPNATRVVSMEFSGDSLVFRDNTFRGTGIGVYTKPISGAAIQIYEGNNMTSDGGAFYIEDASQIKLIRNQMEMIASQTGSETAVVTLDNSVGVDLIGNNINARSYSACIRSLGGASAWTARENVLAVEGAKKHLLIDSDSGGSISLYSDNHLYLNSSPTDTLAYTNSKAANPWRNCGFRLANQQTVAGGGVSSVTGTMTTATADWYYTVEDGDMHFYLTCYIANNGTGATLIKINTPYTIGTLASVHTVNGFMSSIGCVAVATIGPAGTFITVRKYDNSYPGSNGEILAFEGKLPL